MAQGTLRADRHGANDEPTPPAADLAPPYWLKGLARRVWEERAPALHKEGLLTELDVEMFAHACVQLAKARRGDEKALAAAFRILARFGVTPSHRAGLNVRPTSADPFEDFLRKAK